MLLSSRNVLSVMFDNWRSDGEMGRPASSDGLVRPEVGLHRREIVVAPAIFITLGLAIGYQGVDERDLRALLTSLKSSSRRESALPSGKSVVRQDWTMRRNGSSSVLLPGCIRPRR